MAWRSLIRSTFFQICVPSTRLKINYLNNNNKKKKLKVDVYRYCKEDSLRCYILMFGLISLWRCWHLWIWPMLEVETSEYNTLPQQTSCEAVPNYISRENLKSDKRDFFRGRFWSISCRLSFQDINTRYEYWWRVCSARKTSETWQWQRADLIRLIWGLKNRANAKCAIRNIHYNKIQYSTMIMRRYLKTITGRP